MYVVYIVFVFRLFNCIFFWMEPKARWFHVKKGPHFRRVESFYPMPAKQHHLLILFQYSSLNNSTIMWSKSLFRTLAWCLHPTHGWSNKVEGIQKAPALAFSPCAIPMSNTGKRTSSSRTFSNICSSTLQQSSASAPYPGPPPSDGTGRCP